VTGRVQGILSENKKEDAAGSSIVQFRKRMDSDIGMDKTKYLSKNHGSDVLFAKRRSLAVA
jgi:hypothetical protein